MVSAAPVLRIEGVEKAFGGLRVLRGCTFDVTGPGVTCLIGPNGAGKTTLFHIISGFLRPDKGRIYLKGLDVTGHRPEQLVRLGLARTFQLLRVFQRMTVLDNVLLAFQDQVGERPLGALVLPPAVRRQEAALRRRAQELLETLGLAGRSGDWVGNLSYAEQKLVSLAQLLATGADVLLLDEPASGLDRTSARRLLGIVRGLAQEGRTVVVVEHNVSLVRELADRVVFLHEGIVYAEGPADQVIGDPRLAEVYFGLGRSG
ncbi:MAG: ABC transporter ATP-binding protein [Clostridia bacterium]|nr:ABC transporter ATP-binding protein [Clostridia bacterium]